MILTTWLTRKRHVAEWAGLSLIAGYMVLSWVLLVTVVIPTVNGISEVRVGADSGTYWQLAKIFKEGGPEAQAVTFLSFTSNLLGPVGLGILAQNATEAALCNLLLLGIAIWAVGGVPAVNRIAFTILLFFNAETAVSIVTLNKEIFALTSIALIARYLHQQRRSYTLLFFSLVLGLLARWEQTAILLLFLFLQRSGSFLERHPRISLSGVILALTIVYPTMLQSNRVDLQGFAVQSESGNSIAVINSVQSHYGFALVLFPKVFMMICGGFARPWYFFTTYLGEDFSDLQNYVFIHLHEIAMMVLIVAFLAKKKMQLNQPIPFLICLYLIVTAINPFIQPRYEYPVYVLLAIELARVNNRTNVRQEDRSNDRGSFRGQPLSPGQRVTSQGML